MTNYSSPAVEREDLQYWNCPIGEEGGIYFCRAKKVLEKAYQLSLEGENIFLGRVKFEEAREYCVKTFQNSFKEKVLFGKEIYDWLKKLKGKY
ncbi:hypothetical protein HN832_04425 [archaeon]|jgi:hypothetical protein|nr:hypothetical protein [archaeon]MBT4373361.1 hypothetical protein [archaeon]MBT4531809.1 hypothetical protein [archaeon]MBT7001476.1 hypothetical protein [archaeon]MBT7282632.1 hypothetical protein [archaeon]